MEKRQISGLVGILISAAIAIAALWGYNIVVVQPMAEQVAQNTADLYGVAAQGGRSGGRRHERYQFGREWHCHRGHGVDGHEWRTDDHRGWADHHRGRTSDHGGTG